MMKDYTDPPGFRPAPGTYRCEFVVIGENGYPTQYHGIELYSPRTDLIFHPTPDNPSTMILSETEAEKEA